MESKKTGIWDKKAALINDRNLLNISTFGKYSEGFGKELSDNNMLSAMLKRQCKLVTLVILITFKCACGQKSQAYEVVNGVYADFFVRWYGESIFHYNLLNKSFGFPTKNSLTFVCYYSTLPTSTKLIDTLSTFIPREDAFRMLTDTSFVGTIWKQKYLVKANVVNQKKYDYLMSEKGFKEYERKVREVTEETWSKKMGLPIGFEHEYSNKCFKISYPIFDSKREYALIYLTDDFWTGCYYLCHLINGKFDKIVFKNCWQFQI